jgi:hypothetical protein
MAVIPAQGEVLLDMIAGLILDDAIEDSQLWEMIFNHENCHQFKGCCLFLMCAN